jgi:hypothetical protein
VPQSRCGDARICHRDATHARLIRERRSLGIFQLGEQSGGNTLLGLARRQAARHRLPALVRITECFVREEQRHAATLLEFMQANGIARLEKDWTDGVFRLLQRLAGFVRVLIAAQKAATAVLDCVKSFFYPRNCDRWDLALVSSRAEKVAGTSRGVERMLLRSTANLESCAQIRHHGFEVATYILSAAALAVTAHVEDGKSTLAFCIAAILCGWSELDGLCGSSHVGTITPLRAVQPRLWVKAVAGYTLGGLVTAVLIGGLIGLAGSLLGLSEQLTYIGISALTGILITRELGFIRFRLPQLHRQTMKMWAFDYGVPTAATMWGAHIGLGVATVVKHGGFYALIALVLAAGPTIGAAIFAAYWLGRSLPLWIAPSLASLSRDGAYIAELAVKSPLAYRLAAVSGLLCVLGTALRVGWA